jgi:hypothetical protein
MAVYQVTYWQEIPSQVDARDPGGKMQKIMLSQRFQELIDIVATKRKFDTSDLYISQWAKGEKLDQPGAAADVVKAVAADFEARFDAIRAEALAKSTSAKTA